MKANISPSITYWQKSGSRFMGQNADNQSLEKHGE